MRKILAFMFVTVVAVGAVAACKLQGPKQEGIDQLLATVRAEGAKHPDQVNRISIADLKTAIAKGQVVVVDVRGQSAYDAGHIKGSIMIAGNEIGSRIADLPKDKLIVTYCS